MALCLSRDQWQVAFLRGRYWDHRCLTSLSATWTVGLSTPSASLLMTPNCAVWLTHRREGMPSRGTLAVLRARPMQTSWISTRSSARSCTSVTATPNPKAGQRMDWEQPWGDEFGGAGWWEAQKWPESVHLQPRKPTVFWAASKEAWPAVWRRSFCPSTLLCWDPTWSSASSSGALSTGKTGTCWSGSGGGHKIRGLEHLY